MRRAVLVFGALCVFAVLAAAAPAQEEDPPWNPRELLANFVHEPTMAQVREAAIRYAEVSPEKITRWRRHAALHALLPSVDMGWDRDHSLNTHFDEGTFPRFQIIETEDRDAGVDVSLKWELGNLDRKSVV